MRVFPEIKDLTVYDVVQISTKIIYMGTNFCLLNVDGYFGYLRVDDCT